jgi:hypothetical protein
MCSKFKKVSLFSFLLLHIASVKSQTISLVNSVNASKRKTVAVIYSDTSTIQPGYTLLCPSNSTKTFLINNNGRVLNQWTSDYLPGQSAYLTEDGSLVRSLKSENKTFKLAGIGGGIEKRDWNNQLLWRWELNDTTKCLHHDIAVLPNGNILAILVERKSLNDVLKSGRDTSKLSEKELWPEAILEIKPKGKADAEIVWEWHAWDHLVQDKNPALPNYGKIDAHPELIDINFNTELNSSADFLHFNSIDYNPELNQILVSVRNYHEVWIVDHSTSTAQAKTHKGGKTGKGGDLIYRWGNAGAYNINQETILDGQHAASWIKKGYINEGKITIFDNRAKTRNSRAVIIDPALTKNGYQLSQSYLPLNVFWEYTQSTLSEGRGGGLTGLPNGNVLICETSKGRLTEITPDKDTAWIYIMPLKGDEWLKQGSKENTSVNLFKANKYAPSFKGFANKNMVPGATLEMNPESKYGRINVLPTVNSVDSVTVSLATNPVLKFNETKLLYNTPVSVYNAEGQLIDEQVLSKPGKWYLEKYKEGIYYFGCKGQITKVVLTK